MNCEKRILKSRISKKGNNNGIALNNELFIRESIPYSSLSLGSQGFELTGSVNNIHLDKVTLSAQHRSEAPLCVTVN